MEMVHGYGNTLQFAVFTSITSNDVCCILFAKASPWSSLSHAALMHQDIEVELEGDLITIYHMLKKELGGFDAYG